MKTYFQKMRNLQLNLDALQRGKRTSNRAKRINTLKANIQSLKNLSGRNSNTIEQALQKITNKYSDINKQERLSRGGKKRNVTIRKNKLKSKTNTFRKNRK
jgi:hypothetical protein